MKKLISVILLFAFCLSCFSVNMTASALYDEETALDIAISLNILDADANERQDENITRQEFIYGLINLLGIGYTNEMAPFSDVGAGEKYAKSIHTAYELGLVSGYGDSTFRPYDEISTNSAARLLCYILGYKELLQRGLPLVKACSESGICTKEEATKDEALSVKDAARFFVNTLNAYLVSPDIISHDSTSYRVLNETLGENARDVKRIEGIVRANEITFIDEENSLDPSYVMIGSTLLKTGNTNAVNLIGQNVICYYKKGVSARQNEILFIKPYENNILTIDAKNIIGYNDSDKKLSYYDESDDKKQVKISLFDANVIYNNKLTLSPESSDFIFENGNVTLIDNNNDKIYDVAVIKSFETYIVEMVDTVSKKVYTKWGKGALDFSNDENVSFLSETGTQMDLVEVLEYDVLDVYFSKDKTYMSVVYTYSYDEGIIEEVANGVNPQVVINGKKYNMTNDFYINQLNDVKGKEAVFSLNSNGEIACASFNSKKGLNYGYIISIGSDNSLKPTLKIKYLAYDGKIYVKELTDKVKLNSKFLEVSENIDIFKALKEELMLYRVNADDKISYIDTPSKLNANGTYDNLEDNESKDSLCHYDTASDYQYRSETGIFAGKIAINSKTLIFRVPSDPSKAKDEYYDIITLNQFVSNDAKRSFKAYRSSEETLCAEAIVKKENYSTRPEPSEDTVVSVIDEVSQIVNDEGDVVYKVKAYTNSSLATYITEDENVIDSITHNDKPYKLQKGDVVRVVNNIKGITRNIVPVYVHKDKTTMEMADGGKNPNSTSFIARYRVLNGSVYQTSGNYFYTTTTKLVEGNSYDKEDLENFELRTFKGYQIIICDLKEETIAFGNQADVIGFINTGCVDSSNVFIHDRYGDSKTLVVYK